MDLREDYQDPKKERKNLFILLSRDFSCVPNYSPQRENSDEKKIFLRLIKIQSLDRKCLLFEKNQIKPVNQSFEVLSSYYDVVDQHYLVLLFDVGNIFGSILNCC